MAEGDSERKGFLGRWASRKSDALKGMITILPDVDLTEPAYADWKKLYGED